MIRRTFTGPLRALRRIITIAILVGCITFALLVVTIVVYIRDTTFPLFIPFVVFALYYPITNYLNKRIKAYRYSLVIDEHGIEKRYYGRQAQYMSFDVPCTILEKKDGAYLYWDDEEMILHASLDDYSEILKILREHIT